MSEPQITTAAGLVTGSAGFTFPLWSETVALITGANQFLVSVLGLTVLILTVRKLWLENRRLDRDRRLDREDR